MSDSTNQLWVTQGVQPPTVDQLVAIKRQQLGMMREVFNSVITSRRNLLTAMLGERRDIEKECDHPALSAYLDGEYFQALYDRVSVAARVVEVYPKESWQVTPTVYESEDPEELTPFEQAWVDLINRLHNPDTYHRSEEGAPFWEYLLRADILSGIGRYGIIFLGLDGSSDMSSDPGATPGRKLLYMRCFPETLAKVSEWETNPASPRYGQPTFYSVTFTDPRTGAIGATSVTKKVHWRRAIHIADNLTSSEVLGVPRMQQVVGQLLDLRKLYGGSAEMYWLGAFPGYSFESHPQLGADADMDFSAMKDEVENFMHGLQRFMGLVGMSAKSLAPQVVDPSPQIERQIEAVCIRLGIPKRVFMGTERGELASSQDDAAWNDRVKHRQRYYNTPRIICPLIDRLIDLGVLPAPKKPKLIKVSPARKKKSSDSVTADIEQIRNELYDSKQAPKTRGEGGYVVSWPDLTSQADKERAAIAMIHTQALAQYAKSNVESYFPLMYFLTTILHLPEEEALAITQAAEVRRKEVIEEKQSLATRQAELMAKTKGATETDRTKGDAAGAGDRTVKQGKGGNN